MRLAMVYRRVHRAGVCALLLAVAACGESVDVQPREHPSAERMLRQQLDLQQQAARERREQVEALGATPR